MASILGQRPFAAFLPASIAEANIYTVFEPGIHTRVDAEGCGPAENEAGVYRRSVNVSQQDFAKALV